MNEIEEFDIVCHIPSCSFKTAIKTYRNLPIATLTLDEIPSYTLIKNEEYAAFPAERYEAVVMLKRLN